MYERHILKCKFTQLACIYWLQQALGTTLCRSDLSIYLFALEARILQNAWNNIVNLLGVVVFGTVVLCA